VKEFGEARRCHGMAEVVALSLATPLGLKEGELFSCLHSLSNDPLLEALAHADRCADNQGIVWIGGEALHERLVDLEGVDRKLLQLGSAERFSTNAAYASRSPTYAWPSGSPRTARSEMRSTKRHSAQIKGASAPSGPSSLR
jgi:hypothetical protein